MKKLDGLVETRGCMILKWYWKVVLDQMFMFDGPLQVLYYALPPNTQVLFRKPGTTPFHWLLTSL